MRGGEGHSLLPSFLYATRSEKVLPLEKLCKAAFTSSAPCQLCLRLQQAGEGCKELPERDEANDLWQTPQGRAEVQMPQTTVQYLCLEVHGWILKWGEQGTTARAEQEQES